MKKIILILGLFYQLNSIPPMVKPKLFGRFGDRLSCIYKAICFSYKYNIKFACQEFEYSDQLKIHDIIPKISKDNLKKFKKIILINSEKEVSKFQNDFLYEVSYHLKMDFSSEIMDKAYETLKTIIVPKRKINIPIKMPTNCTTVAVHVRRGGGFDKPLLSRSKKFQYADVNWPEKFPPDSFYIEQIKKIFEILDKKRMHVHIFTDDKNPELIVQKYQKIINEPLIRFSYRKDNNNYKDTTIDDFFSMTKFDCLIRSQSQFSMHIERFGNFKIVIIPTHFIWAEKDKLIVDEVGIKVSPEIQKLIDEREIARKEKNWTKADEIRDRLKEMGN